MAANRLKVSEKRLRKPGGKQAVRFRRTLFVVCLAYCILIAGTGDLTTAYAGNHTPILQSSLLRSNLPQWPDEFGKPQTLARAARWPGYKAVIGPDSTIWCITLSPHDSSAQGAFVLTQADMDLNVLSDWEIQPLHGDVLSFDVAVTGDSALIFWAEKRGDDYHILLKQIRRAPGWNSGSEPELGLEAGLDPGPDTTSETLVLFGPWTFSEVPSAVQDVSIAVSGGTVFLGWVDQEEGRPAAFISQVDVGLFNALGIQEPVGEAQKEAQVQTTLANLPKVRISPLDTSVIALKLVPAPSGVWATWLESGAILNKVMLSPYLDGQLKPPIELMQTGSAGLEGIAPLVTQDGLCHLIFTRGRVHQGTVRRPTVVYGVLDSDGYWLMQPVNITQGEGEASGPSAVLDDGTIAMAWADNRSGKFQIHHAMVRLAEVAGLQMAPVTEQVTEPVTEQITEQAPQLGLISYGAATLSSKECFFPEMLLSGDGTRAILYQVYLAEGDMLIQGVSSRNPVEPGWAYYLGLVLDNPMQDGFFKIIMALAAACLFTLLALPSLAVGVGLTLVADKLNVFSDTSAGASLRSLFLFGVVFLMKRPGAWYYAYAPILPAGLSWLSFWLASIAVLCMDIQSVSYKKDLLSTALSGVLYIFFDNLFCTVLKGVGLV